MFGRIGGRSSSRGKARREQRDRGSASPGYNARQQRKNRFSSGDRAQEATGSTKYRTSHRGWKKSRDDKPQHWLPASELRQHKQQQWESPSFPGEKPQRSGSARSDREKKAAEKHVTPMQWAHETALRSASTLGRVPLKRISTRIPWRAGTGKSALIHPLRAQDFWMQFFGRQAVVLHRGPQHHSLMTSSTAAGLMRLYKLGVNADIMGPHIWAPGAKSPRYGPERGMPAVVALSRGKPVRLQMVHLRRRSLLRADPLFAAIARFSPGRGVGLNLHWAPPRGQSLWEHQDWYHQIILQVYGVRNWTVCSRGLKPAHIIQPLPEESNEQEEEADGQTGSSASEQVAKCVTTILRRGDVLYVPANTWHWTSQGPKAAAHLEMGISPLVGADLVTALNGRHRVRQIPHRTFGIPLALWRHKNAVDAAELVSYQCSELPWLETTRDHQLYCSLASVRIALAKLSGSTGRLHQGWSGAGDKPANGPINDHMQRARSAREARRKAGILGPLGEVLRPAGEVLGIIGVIFLLLWVCMACSPDKDGGRSRRQQVRQARDFKRKQKSAASKKDD